MRRDELSLVGFNQRKALSIVPLPLSRVAYRPSPPGAPAHPAKNNAMNKLKKSAIVFMVYPRYSSDCAHHLRIRQGTP